MAMTTTALSLIRHSDSINACAARSLIYLGQDYTACVS